MADFCVVEDLEEFLQVEITTAVQIASAERAIAEASAAIRNYCNQYIELVEDDTITLDSNGNVIVILPELPVVSVSEVVEDDELLTVDDDYKLGQWGILYRIGARWEAGIQILEITYTHGYTTIPVDVVAVCVRAASRAYQMGLKAAVTEGVPGVSAMSLGDYSVSYAGEASASEGLLGASGSRMLLLSEKDMLNRYRYIPA